jgi:hypothetical protein
MTTTPETAGAETAASAAAGTNLARVNGIELAWMSRHRLAILPGVTHYDINASPALAATIGPFLDEER